MCEQSTQQATETTSTSYPEIKGVYGDPSRRFHKFTNSQTLGWGLGQENGPISLTVGPIYILVAVLKTRLQNSSNTNSIHGISLPPLAEF